jgi:hypothetical protein
MRINPPWKIKFLTCIHGPVGYPGILFFSKKGFLKTLRLLRPTVMTIPTSCYFRAII